MVKAKMGKMCGPDHSLCPATEPTSGSKKEFILGRVGIWLLLKLKPNADKHDQIKFTV